MKKIVRQFLTLVTAAALAVTGIPSSAFAQTSTNLLLMTWKLDLRAAERKHPTD